MKLPRIILGANPFHGISYRSHQDRIQYRERFSSIDNVLKVISRSFELGVRGIHVFTTDIQIEAIVRAKEKFGDELIVVAIMPDLYSAAARQTGSKANESTSKLKQLLKNMPALVQAGIRGDLKKLIDKVFKTEMEIVKKTSPHFILLHGFLVDIACATGQKYALTVFKEQVNRIGAIPGINSHNYGRTHAMLKQMELQFPIVETAFNARGYMMNPSREACIEVMNSSKSVTHIGKKVLAGGVIPPLEAFQYVFNDLNLPSASVGIASIEEAEETFAAASLVLNGNISQTIEVNESD